MAEASPESSPVTPGLVIAETYELTRMIGQGGMGAVWEARHLRLPGKKVAVKVLLASAAPGSELAGRFRREAEIAARLAHPAIVQVLDFNVLPSGQPYLVMELLQGESLARRLSRGPVPLDEALALVRQIGGALQTAHRAGVVHRDLKPDNVFLVPPEDDGPPRVKVLDFGISKMLGSTSLHTQEQRVMGTPQYMAPEQAKGQNSAIDGRTDLFSLGAIVYEMLGGRAPFAGDTLAELVFKVVYEPHQPLGQMRPELPASVAQAVDKALAKEPADRFTDASAFVTALTGRPLPQGEAADPRRSQEALAQTISSQDQLSPVAMAATLASQDQAKPAFAVTAPLAPTGPAAEASMKVPRQAPDVIPRMPEPESVHPPRTHSRAPMILATLVVLGGIGGLVAWQLGKKGPPVAVAITIDGGTLPLVADAAPVAVPPDAAPPSPPDAGVIVRAPAGKKPVDKPPVKEPEKPPVKEPEGDDDGGPAAVKALLDQAASASPEDAIRLAKRALAEQPSPGQERRARFIIARSYCTLGDLSSAKPAWNKLPAGPRKKLVREVCAKHGVDLP